MIAAFELRKIPLLQCMIRITVLHLYVDRTFSCQDIYSFFMIMLIDKHNRCPDFTNLMQAYADLQRARTLAFCSTTPPDSQSLLLYAIEGQRQPAHDILTFL